MDSSKAYDCLPHYLLIAILKAYGLDVNSLRLIYSYLDSRLQRLKIDSHRSYAKEIKKLGSHKDRSKAPCSLIPLSLTSVPVI